MLHSHTWWCLPLSTGQVWSTLCPQISSPLGFSLSSGHWKGRPDPPKLHFLQGTTGPGADVRGSSSSGVNLPQWEGNWVSLFPRTKSARLPTTTRGHSGPHHVWGTDPAIGLGQDTSLTFPRSHDPPGGSPQRYLGSLQETNSYSWPTRLFWSLLAGTLWMGRWLSYLKHFFRRVKSLLSIWYFVFFSISFSQCLQFKQAHAPASGSVQGTCRR